MKTIGYFTKSNQITDAESAELDSIANAIQYKLRVLNSESSAEFGASSVAIDFANGTVPDNFKSLPKFVSITECDDKSTPGFLKQTIDITTNIDHSFDLNSKFGIEGLFDAGGAYSYLGGAPYYHITDGVFNIRVTVADHYIVILRNRSTGGNVALMFNAI